MIKTWKNIGANYIGQFWGLISVFLFVPFYLKFLGIESYGLVGFYITLMGVLAFADIGLTATMNREMARLSVGGNTDRERNNLLRTYEVTYFFISLLIIFIGWLLAPSIAESWLQSESYNSEELIIILMLMIVAISLQLPSNLYIGGLIGLQKQVVTNILQIGWSVLRGGGSVLVLWLVSPTILAFICWQLFCNFVYFISSRAVILREVEVEDLKPRFEWLVFKNTWRYALGMALMSSVSITLLQLDKIAVSKFLSLEMLGYYTLAITLASIPSMLAGPIIKAVFPRFTTLVKLGDKETLIKLYHQTSQLIALAIIPAGLTCIIFSKDLIYVWTGFENIAQKTSEAASFLLAGSLMQSITVAAFYVALAHGNVRLNLKVGLVSIILLSTFLMSLIPEYGIEGASMSWFFMNLCIFFPYIYFLHTRFLYGELKVWMISSLIIPLAVSIPILLLCRLFMPDVESRILTFLMIGFVWLFAIVPLILVNSDMRILFTKSVRKIFGVDQHV